MQQATLEFCLSSDADFLCLEVRIDGHTHWQGHADHALQTIKILFDDDDDSDHVLEFIMSGKTIEHTKINAMETVTHDVLMHISDIHFESMDVTQIIFEQSQYHHDFNGTRLPVIDKFYGHMGCNGTVRLEFTTPIYLWLLENM
jgi:hypothetical protein